MDKGRRHGRMIGVNIAPHRRALPTDLAMQSSPLPACLVLVCTLLSSSAAPFPGAVKEADLDVAACQILHRDEASPLDAEALSDLLGFTDAEEKRTKHPRTSRA